MFDAQGNYNPPDKTTRHALVVTKNHDGVLGRGGQFTIPVPAGFVVEVAMLGHTNVPGHQVQYRHPQAGAVWIEHTANKHDVIPMAELSAAVALAEKRMAAVKAFWAKNAEAAKAAKA